MAIKVVLGKRPKTFKPAAVRFPMPDGTEGVIEVTYQYRTRTEFGLLIDEVFRDAAVEPDADKQGSLAHVMEQTIDKNAAYLIKVISEWNLDSELNEDNLRQLCNEVPSAASALMECYRTATIEGKLGN